MTFKNKIILGLVLATTVLINSNSFAQTAQPMKVNGVDITPLYKFFQTYVKTLDRSIFVYSWSEKSSNESQPSLSSNLTSLAHVRRAAQGYWKNRAVSSTSNNYGLGLYAAVDPLITRAYGGKDSWNLIRMKLPAGFRFIEANLPLDKRITLSDENIKILEALKCSSKKLGSPLEPGIFFGPEFSESPTCTRNLKIIFDQLLQIDALVYNYETSNFSACAHESKGVGLIPALDGGLYLRENEDWKSAFVITSDRWIQPELVRVFNASTTDEVEERIKIQSLFYKYTHDMYDFRYVIDYFFGSSTLPYVFSDYPGYHFVRDNPTWNYKTGNSNKIIICPMGITDYNHPQCLEIPPVLPPRPDYPTRISSEDLFKDIRYTGTSYPVLWKDLEGKETYKDIDSWIKKNFFGCSDVYIRQ